MRQPFLSKAEKGRYSIRAALLASATGNWGEAGLEAEVSDELYRLSGRTPPTGTSFMVPTDLLARDMTVAGVSGSNYLVGGETVGFIDLLRARSVVFALGAELMPGLVGNVTIPKMTAGNTAYWLADEATQITESQPTIGQLSLSPKNVAALTEFSRQLLLQSSPAADRMIASSIVADIALAVDKAALQGAGAAGQPLGIVNTGGIGSVVGTSLGLAGVLELQSDVAANNALQPGAKLAYATTSAVAALLQARQRFTNTDSPIWVGGLGDGQVAGYRAISSAQVPAATLIFGAWERLIVAEWGVLELMTNPFSDFSRGLIAVRGMYSCDVGVRYAGAFSVASSIT